MIGNHARLDKADAANSALLSTLKHTEECKKKS